MRPVFTTQPEKKSLTHQGRGPTIHPSTEDDQGSSTVHCFLASTSETLVLFSLKVRRRPSTLRNQLEEGARERSKKGSRLIRDTS